MATYEEYEKKVKEDLDRIEKMGGALAVQKEIAKQLTRLNHNVYLLCDLKARELQLSYQVLGAAMQPAHAESEQPAPEDPTMKVEAEQKTCECGESCACEKKD
jgi:hypothetical protein